MGDGTVYFLVEGSEPNLGRQSISSQEDVLRFI